MRAFLCGGSDGCDPSCRGDVPRAAGIAQRQLGGLPSSSKILRERDTPHLQPLQIKSSRKRRYSFLLITSTSFLFIKADIVYQALCEVLCQE